MNLPMRKATTVAQNLAKEHGKQIDPFCRRVAFICLKQSFPAKLVVHTDQAG
jgi:hypothetical protein